VAYFFGATLYIKRLLVMHVVFVVRHFPCTATTLSAVIAAFAGLTDAEMVKGFRKDTNRRLQTDMVTFFHCYYYYVNWEI